VRVRVLDGLRQLDAAALAAASGVDLRLHHDDGIAFGEELLRGLVGLFKVGGHLARRDGHAIAAQDLFGLVLVNLHGSSEGSYGTGNSVRGNVSMVATRERQEQAGSHDYRRARPETVP